MNFHFSDQFVLRFSDKLSIYRIIRAHMKSDRKTTLIHHEKTHRAEPYGTCKLWGKRFMSRPGFRYHAKSHAKTDK